MSPSPGLDEVEIAVESSRLGDRDGHRLAVDLPIVEIATSAQGYVSDVQTLVAVLPRGWDAVAKVRWGSESSDDVQRVLMRREEFEWAHAAGFGPSPPPFEPDTLLSTVAEWSDDDIERRLAH